ncbi:MAG: hypothetical protein AVO39_09230 [delta proteobacterium MLS_D]|jgi:glycosyltransferase involved in cell wall biosynthesis|nr:MAG: hypothetical protein AVO39_09230 [delta proteobacterium MLS_D]
MRVLHVVKTSDGARWAALQAGVLTRAGIDVHVVVPSAKGDAIPLWEQAGAVIHVLDCSLPIQAPLLFSDRARKARSLIARVQPDIIHNHFVTTTMFLRLALGRNHPVPRLFQVPGPLHLEHALYRRAETATAGGSDYWIASSRYTRNLYLANHVPADRVFLSYYGFRVDSENSSHDGIRARLKLDGRIVGNINYMYPPKYYLGQTRGLKRHEDVIEALGIVCRRREDVAGVFVGGQWGVDRRYEERLRRQAARAAGTRIVFAGKVPHENAADLWHGFDLAVHTPVSENCGGVAEPLLAGVPTIASSVGGLPEVVLHGVTGWLVPPSSPTKLSNAILYALDNEDEARRMALRGQELVRHMFDVDRTGAEIADIYEAVTKGSPAGPAMFDPESFVANL